MDDLRKRKSSLDPPYPSFAEFLQACLETQTAKDFAAGFSHQGNALHEDTIIAWSAGHPPNRSLRDQITKKTGYHFGERAFYEAARETGFPPADAHPDIASILKIDDLRLYLLTLRDVVRLESLTNFFDLSSSSLIGGFVSDDAAGLSHETLVRILRKLPEVPRHVSGEILSELTPISVVATVLRNCRHKSGMKRQHYADHLGVGESYLRFLEEFADAKEARKVGGVKDPERYRALCATLMKERARLGLAPSSPEEEMRAPAVILETESPPIVDPSSLPAPVPEVKGAAALWTEIHRLWEAVRALQDNGASSDAPYRSPFAPERWHEHDNPIGPEFVTAVGDQIMALCENLGVLAGVRDETQRARIRAALEDTLLVELLGAIEAFVQKYPGEALRLLESRRQFFSGLKR